MLTVLLLLLASAAYTYRLVRSRIQVPETNLTDTPQIWAHRGYLQGPGENTIKSFDLAFKAGAKGIELDTHFDLKLDRFVITHDKPYQKHNGRLLYLESVFETFGNAGYYWVDLKNLSAETLEPVSHRMRILLETYQLEELVFIESWHGDQLSELSNRGFQTLYWINLNHEAGSPDYLGELHRRRGMLINSQFSALSGDYRTFLRYPQDVLDNYPLFVFTINDQQVLDQFLGNPRVKVILTDNPQFYQTGNGITTKTE